MNTPPANTLVVLGPTASGKTRLGVLLANKFGGEVVSADSRQVYRGLDIGSGKDLEEYVCEGVPIPYHLVDVAELDHEFSVFEYQQRFFEIFEVLHGRGAIPVLTGGTGLYIEAALSDQRMLKVPENPTLREELSQLPEEALVQRLQSLKTSLHNTTDLTDRTRLVRAIEIATYECTHEPEPAPEVRPFIIGTRWPRKTLRARIHRRLVERVEAGLIEEVESLLASGVLESKLDFLGLEYRFVNQFLRGEIKNRNDLVQKLHVAICQFAKRQETWFRRMERRGAAIHWVDQADGEVAVRLVREEAHLAKQR